MHGAWELRSRKSPGIYSQSNWASVIAPLTDIVLTLMEATAAGGTISLIDSDGRHRNSGEKKPKGRATG